MAARGEGPTASNGDRVLPLTQVPARAARPQGQVKVARPGDPTARKHRSWSGTIAWLHHYRRPQVCYECRADIHQAVLTVDCRLIPFKQLQAVESF